MNKTLYILLGVLVGLMGCTWLIAHAATSIFQVQQGGTGTSTVTISSLLVGEGANAFQSVATTSVTCSGAASCGAFTVIGNSPITISASLTGATISTTSGLTIGQGAYYTSITPTIVGGFSTSTLIGTGIVTITNSPFIIGASGAVASITGGSNGQILGWLGGVPTWTASSSVAAGTGISVSASGAVTTITNTGVLSVVQNGGGSAQTGALTFATSSATSFNGLSISNSITNSSGTFTFAPNTITGTLTVGGGGTGQSTFTSSQLLYGNGTNALSSVSTSSPTQGTGITLSGVGSVVGGSLTITNAGVISVGNGMGVTCTGTNPASCSLAAIAANSVLANQTGASAIPSALATSSLYTFPWTVSNGGTGTTTTNTNGVVYSDGTRLIEDFNKLSFNGTLFGIATGTPFANFAVATGTILNAEFVPASTSTSQNVNWLNGTQQVFKFGTAGITVTFSGVVNGQTLKMITCAPDAGTMGTITWPAGIRWTGGTTPSQTTTAQHCDVYSFLATQGTSTTAGPTVYFGAQTSNF